MNRNCSLQKGSSIRLFLSLKTGFWGLLFLKRIELVASFGERHHHVSTLRRFQEAQIWLSGG
jgi:hypothetical protein